VERHCATSPSLPRDERGFTIIEIVVAALLLAIGLSAVVFAFVGSQKLTQVAQGQTQAIEIAEADLESILGRPYANIAVTSLPSHAADSDVGDASYTANANNPSNPLYYVNDPTFFTAGCTGTTFPALNNYYNAGAGQLTEAPACGEQLVPAATGGVLFSASTQTVFPGAPAGTVYNFITWRNEKCTAAVPAATIESKLQALLASVGNVVNTLVALLFPTGGTNPAAQFCSSPNNGKRVTVAVVINKPGNLQAPAKPVYVSTIIPDPAAGAPKSSGCSGLLELFCG
jgi:prepilin-type N-terminal cleavage/methylation domain-containing protein